jgi:hypothetical protein
MARYKSHALKLHTDGMGSAVWLGGMLRTGNENQHQVVADPVAGSPYPLFAELTEIKNRFTFETFDLKRVLDTVGLNGLSLVSATNPGLELYEVFYDAQGAIASGSVHRKIAIRNGRLVLRQLQCQHRQDARISLEAFAISADGDADPITFTESIAVPTAAVDDARWTIHDLVLESIAAGCLMSVNIDFGLTIDTTGCSSGVFDQFIDLTKVMPKLTATTKKTNIFASANIGIKGKAVTHANSKFQLRKRVRNTGSFVADATEEHISITCDGIATVPKGFDGSNFEDATADIAVDCTHDGTNVPLVWDTTAAIT